MYWPVLLTSQHNLLVCCVLKLQWRIYSYVPRSPLLQERGHLQLSLSSLWIIVQLVHDNTVLSCMFLSTVTGEWSSPVVTGTKPPALSVFSFTKVDSRRAVVYGGGTGRRTSGDAYVLELDKLVRAI